MEELIHNVSFLPPKHPATRLEPFFRSLPFGWFVGTFVKTAFRAKNGAGEFTWVEITGTRARKLVGALCNGPVYDCGLQIADEVTVSRARIIAVLPGGGHTA